MAVKHLRHPIHGEMAESSEAMIGIAKANGWEEFDPAAVAPEPPAPVVGVEPVAEPTPPSEVSIPSFLKTAEPKPKK